MLNFRKTFDLLEQMQCLEIIYARNGEAGWLVHVDLSPYRVGQGSTRTRQAQCLVNMTESRQADCD